MKTIISFLAFIILAAPAWSATYYIDYSIGSDTANGTSTSTPWKHCPGDTAATSNAAALTPAAGDFIVFKGGVTYYFAASGKLTLKSSGSSGNVITYISGHVHSTPWGTGRAVIDATGAGVANLGVINAVDKSYITIKGLEVTNGTVVPNGSALVGFQRGNYITIDNCYIWKSAYACVWYEGIFDATASPPNHFSVINSDLRNSGGHILNIRYGASNVLIENNYFTGQGDNTYGSGTNQSNSIAFSATNMPPVKSTDQPTKDTIIRGNTFHSTSTGRKSAILLQHWLQNLTVEDNLFTGTPYVSCIDHTSYTDNEIIRNNVFNLIVAYYGGVLRYLSDQGGSGGNADGIHIYNNTFIGYSGLATAEWNRSIIVFHRGDNTSSYTFSNVNIKNNIFDTEVNTAGLIYIGANSAGSAPCVQMSTFACDYNAYYAGTNSTPFYLRSSSYSFTNWKTQIAGDSNSAVGQVTFTDRSGDDFTLGAADTVAKDKGVDLSSSGFSDDMLGASRPYNSLWDIGAYEYTGVDATAPTVTSVSVNGSTATINFSETVVTTGYDTGDFNLDCTSPTLTNVALSSPIGSGSSRTFTIATPIVYGQTCNLDYVGSTDDIEDASGNDMLPASNTDIAVTNSTPNPADSTPPVCIINDPTTNTTWPTSSATITVGGSATDGVGVTSISWACPTCTPASGVATCIGCTDLSVTWSQLVALSSGANVFTATATDGTNTHADSIVITYTPTVSDPPSSVRGINMRGVYRR